jgi:hypothetical protein
MTRIFRLSCYAAGTISGFLLISGPQHAVSQTLSPCTIRDTSSAVAIVVCPRGQSQDKLKQAGEVACRNLASCSAWIWDDEARAPRTAPALATGIAKESVLASVAIWDHDQKKLIVISKEAK